MKRSPKLVLLAIATASLTVAPAEDPLHIGSPAPALKIAKWAKGKPIRDFEKGKVYIVEFWATWCGPCIKGMPHLTELAKKYEGKVTVIGVDIHEDDSPKDESYIPKVLKFVKENEANMGYAVAIDGKEGTMEHTWMHAADRHSIPNAFVIDQQGRVAWIGHPMAGLDGAVDEIVKGTYDIAARREQVESEQAIRVKDAAQRRKFMEPFGLKQYREAIEAYDKVAAEDPNMGYTFSVVRFESHLGLGDRAAAYDFARSLLKDLGDDDEKKMRAILSAYTIVTEIEREDKPSTKEDLTFAAELGDICLAVKQPGTNIQCQILETIATAHARLGNLDKAISYQERAKSAAEAIARFPAERKAEIAKKLEEYRKQKG